MIEHQAEILTPDGAMSTFILHPERNGPHPVVLFFMDAPGIREELRDMARRIAATGYYVMLPNLYYRSGVQELGGFIGDSPQALEARKQMFSLMASIDIPQVMQDVDALVGVAKTDPAADSARIATLGYCMSGQYALSAAARYPDAVKAAASIYGVRLMTDRPDSPHLAAAASRAEIYIAWAEIDAYAPLEQCAPLAEALSAAGVKAEVELYRGVEHGFAFPGRPAYDKAAAERHWERLFGVFGRALAA